ncbi:MAG TPA: hypothetical protein VHG89_08030 [Verrucomicrobiae bacterium]|nr:hypothetical protein [Verrucomicrobiae bacterium]
MSKRTATILSISTLIVGLITGGWIVAAWFNNAAKQLIRHTVEISIQSRVSKIDVEVEELKYLRVNQTTNAINSLEFNLEGDLIELEPFVINSNLFKSEKWNIEVLQKVIDYRNQFPYKTNPDVETNVAEVLNALGAQKN